MINDVSNTIYFEKIELQNFKSVGNISFDFNKHSGLNFVYGWDPVLCTSNGIGKSTFLVDAPLFALFGKTVKPVVKSEIPNRATNRKGCYVKFTFRINGKRWRIEQGISPDYYNLFLINDDGTEEKKNKSKVDLTKEYVKDTILNSNEDVYKYSIIMSTANNSNIFNMKAEDKRKFISKVFQFSDLALMNKLAKENYNELEKKLNIERNQNNILTSNLKMYENKINEYEQEKKIELEKLKQEIVSLVNEYKAIVIIDESVFQTKKNEYEENINVCEKDIQQNNQNIELINKNITSQYEKIKSYNNEKDGYNKFINETQKKINDIENILNQIQIVKRSIANYNMELETTLQSSSSLLSNKTDVTIDDYKNELDKFNNLLNSLSVSEFDANIMKYENEITENENKIQTIQDEIKNFNNIISENKNKISKGQIAIGSKETENINNSEFVEKYNDVLNIVCSDCYSKVDAKFNLSGIKTKTSDNNVLIEKLKKAISQLEENNKQVELSILNSNKSILEIQNTIKQIKNKITAERTNKQSKIDQTAKINKIITELQNVISYYQSRQSGIDMIYDQYKEVLENKKSSNDIDIVTAKHQKNIDQEQERIKKIRNEFDGVTKLIQQNESLIVQYQNEIALIKNFIKEMDTKKREINESVKKLNESILENEKVQGSKRILMEKINDRKKIFEDKKNSKSPYDELIEKTNKDLLSSNKSIEILMDNKNYYELLEIATSDEGVRKDLITNIINMLNNKVKIYLERMGAAYTVVFDQEFEGKFITSTGECSINNFSSGEMRKLEISTIFAIRDILQMQGVLRSNVIVCDEIIDGSICDRTVESIISMVKEESSDKTVFLVSHRYKDEKNKTFDNIIKLEKHREISSIVEDKQG